MDTGRWLGAGHVVFLFLPLPIPRLPGAELLSNLLGVVDVRRRSGAVNVCDALDPVVNRARILLRTIDALHNLKKEKLETKVFKSTRQHRASSSETGFKPESKPDSNWTPPSDPLLRLDSNTPPPHLNLDPTQGKKSDSNCAASPDSGEMLD